MTSGCATVKSVIARYHPQMSLGHKTSIGVCEQAYLCGKLAEVVGLLPERVSRQSIHEAHQTVWEVMLCQPCYHLFLLHVWSRRDVQDQEAQLLPQPAFKMTGKEQSHSIAALCGNIINMDDAT